jgi:hypothetical protein
VKPVILAKTRTRFARSAPGAYFLSQFFPVSSRRRLASFLFIRTAAAVLSVRVLIGIGTREDAHALRSPPIPLFMGSSTASRSTSQRARR